jgi:hypothetical protein
MTATRTRRPQSVAAGRFSSAHARPPAGVEASATPALAIGPEREIGARARHGYASAQARCAQPLTPWRAGSRGRLGS